MLSGGNSFNYTRVMGGKKITISKMSTTAISLFFGFIVLMFTAVSVFQISQRFRDQMTAQTRSGLVMSDTRSLLLVLVDAETAQRGYAITEDPKFLEPYNLSKLRLEQIYNSLNARTKGDPLHQATLVEVKKLMNLEMAFLSDIIQDTQQQRRLAKSALVQQGDQKIVMDQLRLELGGLEAREQKIFTEHAAQADDSAKLLDRVMYVSFSLLLILITVAVATLISDIMERAELQKELLSLKEKAESASRMKSQFLANMSHEIRTPLNGIHGMVELLVKTPLSQEQSDFLSTLKDSSISLLAIINDVLDFSKIESGHIELETAPFQIQQIVDACTKVLRYSAAHKSLNLVTDLDKKIPPCVLGDGLRLRQILINLIGNAVKFSENGQVQIRVQVANEELSRVRLRFEIQDSGVGFDEDTKERLFKVFSQADETTTRKYGGTGLGLAICKQLVEVMGGEIGAESTPGHGAKFWFELPFDVSSVRLKLADKQEIPEVFSGPDAPRVLVVEDHLVNQKVVSSLLTKMGCRFEVASHGLEALEILKHKKFDLVLMDCHMPVLDGYETARRIRNGTDVLQKDIFIVAATANVTTGEKEKCLESGMDDYISKPMSFNDLRAKIYQWAVVAKKEASKSAS